MDKRNTALAQVLRELRKEKGLSQEALAEAANLDTTYISMIERNRRNPTVKALFFLADALEVEASEMLRKAEARNAKERL